MTLSTSPTIAPTTRRTAEAHTSQATVNQKAKVPIVTATSMMMTALHAAGELPWPGSEPADTILLGVVGGMEDTLPVIGRVIAVAQRIPVDDRVARAVRRFETQGLIFARRARPAPEGRQQPEPDKEAQHA